MLDEETDTPTSAQLFLSQKLPMKRVEMTDRLYIALFAPLGLIFLVGGVVLCSSSEKYREYNIEYSEKCSLGTICKVRVEVSHRMKHPIAVLYELKGFYQNHWYSMRSRSDAQLLGKYVRYDDMKVCEPYRSIDDDPSPYKWILPCGLQAITLFNDTYEIEGLRPLSIPDYPLTGIVPKQLNSMYSTGIKWIEDLEESPRGDVQRRFAYWMDTAAFSTMRRVWGITSEAGWLEPQNLTIIITNNYNSSLFNGNKSVILVSHESFPMYSTYLGILFLFVGILMQLATSFAIICKPRSASDSC